jgi:N-acetylglucosamine-6-phosphate deacetylase
VSEFRSTRDVPDLVLRGRVVTSGTLLGDGIVAISGQRIVWVGRADDAPRASWPAAQTVGSTLLPGLIDIHCHGGAGGTFSDGSGTESRAAAHHHLAHGTTGLVASLVTADESAMITALSASADLVDDGVIIGIHLEGPFLSPARCGAQDPAHMRQPDPLMLDRLLDAGRGYVVSMTYAGELAGAGKMVERLTASGVVPSLGHTDATFASASSSLSAAAASAPTGRASVTHLFNGMRPFHHRDPGPGAASLRAARRGEAVVELVADGAHLADATVATVLELVGPPSVALVTDAMAAAGRPDGRYRLGGRTVDVVGAVARLTSAGEQPGALAGGTSRLIDIVRRCVQLAGVDLADAVEAASSTPARLLGVDRDRGMLAAGRRADVLAVDDDLVPVAVWKDGVLLDQIA